MKYIVRSVKYFVYLILVLCIIIAVLVIAGLVEADIRTMFVNGYDSLWQIALMIAVFAAIYPRFGYGSRMVHIPGSYEEIRGEVVSKMEALGYDVETEEGENLCFRRRSAVSRALKMWEDRMVFSRTATGFEVEGISRDLVRVTSLFEQN